MTIQIISGTYGFRPNGGNRVTPINIGEMCDVPVYEAKRLVELGVAQYVADKQVITVPDFAHNGNPDVNLPSTEKPSVFTTDGVEIPGVLDIVEGRLTARSLRQLTNPTLAKLSTDLGLDTEKCRTKADYIAALSALELDFAMTDDENPPELGGEPIVE